MKRALALIPMALPKISDAAAVQLLDILGQLLAAAERHYTPQAHRWHRRQRNRDTLPPRYGPTLFNDDPF